MTREIKFRAWDARDKKMLYTNVVWGSTSLYLPGIEYEDWATSAHADSISELMQYTGLKDKNGVEVYEGDCLGGIYEGTYVGYCETTGGFEVRTTDYCHACGGDIFWSELIRGSQYVEVIGNIHENPELLEEQS